MEPMRPMLGLDPDGVNRPRSIPKLMDSRPAPENYVKEKGWQRMAAHGAARGWSNRQIAEACQKDECTVSALAKQTWWQALVADIINAHESDAAAEELLARALPGATMTIISLAATAENESVRLKAAVSILDRVMGPSVIKNKAPTAKTPEEESIYLDNEIKRLQELRGQG